MMGSYYCLDEESQLIKNHSRGLHWIRTSDPYSVKVML
jgi:hypothetical protein